MNNKIKQVFNTYMCDKFIIKGKIDNQLNKKTYNLGRCLLPTFVALCFVLMIFGVYTYNTPVNHISIDINPSILLSTNQYDKVIKIDALNDDAKKVVENIKLKNKNISDALDMIVDESTKLGYIDKDMSDNAILLSVYCDNKQKGKHLQAKLNNNLNNYMNGHGIQSLLIGQELTTEDIEKANEYGVSQGKILFVKKAISENPELKFEDLIYLPVREIVKYIDDYENMYYPHQDCGSNKGNCNNKK